MANLARARGDFGEAREALTMLLRASDRRGDHQAVTETLAWLGVLAVAEESPGKGVRLMAAAKHERPYFAPTSTPDLRREVEYSLGRAEGLLSQEAFARSWAEGHRLTLGQAVEYALMDLE